MSKTSQHKNVLHVFIIFYFIRLAVYVWEGGRVGDRERETDFMSMHSYIKGEDMWKDIKWTWAWLSWSYIERTSNLSSWKFTKDWWRLWSHIHESLNYCSTKTKQGSTKEQQRSHAGAQWMHWLFFVVFLQCSSMSFLCHAETCIKMKCHTSLPFQSVVQFIFLSSDRVHKFNNYILSCSLYSLSASYSVFSLSLQACRKCLILGFLWRHNRQEKQKKILSII